MMTSSRYGEPIVPEPADGRLTFDELQRAVWAADQAAFLVPPRIARRVIKQDCQLTGFGLRVPHRKSYVIAREPLLHLVEKVDLGVADDFALPEQIILLSQPSPRQLAAVPAGDLLIRCWRLLLHARVHAAMDAAIASGQLTPALIRRRIHELGTTEFDEIRSVLNQEDLLLPPRSDESTYVEFVATYVELRHFAASFLPRYFPGLENLEAVDELIRRDVDAESLYQATRPVGSPDPLDTCELDEWSSLVATEQPLPVAVLPPAEVPSEVKYRILMHKAQRPAALGNVVRAAIYHARAAQCAPPEFIERVQSSLKEDIDYLARRLQSAFEIEATSPRPWQESLFALASQTPRGIWTVEARLLYDLQKACVDHEREIYTVDLVEWALSWGRRPIKRHLPNQRDVLMLKHLRSAAGRLGVVRISDAHRRQLAMLVQEATVRVELRLRERLRPRIAAAINEVGLTPQNLPERVAQKKLVEELLDQICERGFLAMSDLRDAISRNNLKLPDLSEWSEFQHGDKLLRADRKLALTLDGVYRRGEFYLRWMQRLSSLSFGTRLGRFLTRFAAVPFGGAYVALAGVHEAWDLITRHKTAEGAFRLTWPEVVLPLGLFLMCVVNFAAFRKAVGRFFTASFHVFHTVIVEPIHWLLQSPLLQEYLHNRLFPLAFRFGIKPLIWMNILRWAFPLDEASWRVSIARSISMFLAVNILLNSRTGRTMEEIIVDEAVQSWRRFGLRAITGLFWLIVDVFHRVMQTIERLMYSVDEWLRFRSGESRFSFIAKAGMGLLWFFVAYVLRFAVSVLIEPQINPIKHFPVVTVAHKLLLPFYDPCIILLEAKGLSKFMAWSVTFGTIWGIPGVFGFLVWELKENWRLYAANRPRQLRPVMIGSHGETMSRLLKPGFHSGTLPKRYAKLRRAERHARAGGNWAAVYKNMRLLHHANLSIRRCIEREFLELFAESKCWQAPPVTLEKIQLGTNFVRLSLGCPELAEGTLHIAIDSQSGWLLAGASNSTWIDRLLPRQRQVLITAILGLYKVAGIEIVRQQIESEFSPSVPWYDLSAAGLIVWPDDEREVEVLYDLHESPWIAPQSIRGLSRRRLPTVERWRLVYEAIPIDWDRWVQVWNEDIAGQGHPRDSIIPVHVLPS